MIEHNGASSRGKRSLGWIVLVVLLAAGLTWWLRSDRGAAQEAGQASRAARPISVTATQARLGDVPETLTGIGTVTSLKSVTVRSRVDGELLEVLFKEGQMAKAGDLLARIDPRSFEAQLSQYQGQLAKDAALLANARLDLKRYQNLVKKDVLAGQTLDTQASLVRQYEGAVQADQAQIDTAKLQIEYSRITAPISGRVGLRLVDPGNIVHSSDQNGLLVITQVSPISVVFTLPEDNLPAVRERLATGAKLAVTAYDRSMSRKLAEGVLATTDNQIDTATGTVRLRANFDNAGDKLFPNQFVNAVLTLDERKGVVLLPAVAVRRGSQGAFVFVVKADKTVASRPVTTGLTLGTDILVEKGLDAGETVVVEGADRLLDGATVVVRDQSGAKVGNP
jgi:membrane fusion protein, multidrug efflux system